MGLFGPNIKKMYRTGNTKGLMDVLEDREGKFTYSFRLKVAKLLLENENEAIFNLFFHLIGEISVAWIRNLLEFLEYFNEKGMGPLRDLPYQMQHNRLTNELFECRKELRAIVPGHWMKIRSSSVRLIESDLKDDRITAASIMGFLSEPDFLPFIIEALERERDEEVRNYLDKAGKFISGDIQKIRNIPKALKQWREWSPD